MATSDRQKSPFSRIVLGTAQLGMNYGIANQTGRPNEEQTHVLVQSAVDSGLTWFDTAAVYGESEAVLGRAFRALHFQERVNLISKGRLLTISGQTLATSVTESLERLGLPRLNAWLLHDENQLSVWDDRARREAQALRAENRVGAFGVSVYYPDNALRAVEELGLTSVQCPASPLDRRFLRNDVVDRVAAAGAQLYLRSIYLQGLCLMDPDQVPGHISRGREAVQTLADFCVRRGLARDQFCLHYVLQRSAAAGARLVIGVESREQLARNGALLAAPPVAPGMLDEWDAIWPEDHDDLVLPFRWSATRGKQPA
jgi:aryl-alcohol dehydrogenase-like predicted oxidoreductase